MSILYAPMTGLRLPRSTWLSRRSDPIPRPSSSDRPWTSSELRSSGATGLLTGNGRNVESDVGHSTPRSHRLSRIWNKFSISESSNLGKNSDAASKQSLFQFWKRRFELFDIGSVETFKARDETSIHVWTFLFLQQIAATHFISSNDVIATAY